MKKINSFIKRSVMPSAFLFLLAGCSTPPLYSQLEWDDALERDIPAMGKLNWIAVVDAAYPRPTGGGEVVFVTEKKHISVLETVVDAIHDSKHLGAQIITDLELEHIPDRDAPGIDKFRRELNDLVSGWPAAINPAKENMEMFAEAAKENDVLILKTDMEIPYTAVYFKLDCKYWDENREKRLRNAIMNASN